MLIEGGDKLKLYKSLFKRSYFRNLIFSYGIMLLVLFLIYIITSTVMNNVITSERENMISYMSAISKTNIDNEILRVEQMAGQIAARDEINYYQTSSHSGDTFTYNDYKTFQYLKSMLVLDTNIEKIYLFKKGTNKIISSESVATLDDFFEAAHNDGEYTQNAWMRFLGERHNKTLTSLPGIKPEESYIAYAQSLPFSTAGDRDLLLVVLLNTNRITNLALETESLKPEQFAILNKNGEVIFSYGNLLSDEEILSYMDEDGKSVSKTKVKNKKIVAETMKSNVVSWQYVLIMSRDIYNEQIRALGATVILCAVFYLLIGGVMIYFFSKKNYAPLESLLESLKDEEHNPIERLAKGEFDVISDKINAIYQENRELQKLNEDNVNQLQTDYLKSILNNVVSHENFAKNHSPEKYGIETISDSFSVILIKIENLLELSEMSEAGLGPDLIRYAIANVADELISMQKCKGFCITLQNDSMAAVVNLYETVDRQSVQRTLKRIMTDLKQFFEKHYQAVLSFSSTGEGQPLNNLNLCYRQALQAMDYRLIRGKQQIIFYEDICNKKNDYQYDADTEYLLISNIKNGDFEKIQRLIGQLFDKNIYSETISVDAMRLFVFDLVRTLLRNLPRDYMINTETLMTDTARETHDKILGALQRYCEDMKNEADKPIGLRVAQYVEENYQIADLEVNMLGNVFGLAPSYLSKLFKDQMGERLLGYIHKVRIRHSKELLSTDMNLEEIAGRVGYFSADGFSRTFKKYEGVSPGRYRSQNRNQSQK